MFTRVRYHGNKFVLRIRGLLCMDTNSLVRFISSQRNPSTAYHDIYWWNSNITSCFRRGDVETACRLFNDMPFKNQVTWNCMISGYVQNRKISEARKIFDVMPIKNVVSWTALLTGYARCGRLEEAWNLFNKMPERNVACWNSMISGYVNNGRIQQARQLFNKMPVRNSISWVTMIEGYLQHNIVKEALALFDQVPEKTTPLYNTLLAWYVEMGYLDAACQLFNKMAQRDVASCTIMITCYSRAGQMENAKHLFGEMPERDTAAWTAIIRGYMHNGKISDALNLFEEMPHRDVVAWNSMIGGYVQNGMLENALQLFMQMPRRDIISWNSVLHGYVLQDDIVNARCFFEKMQHRDEISWNTIIAAYQSEEALVLYCRMLHDGFKPDQVTFTRVISVCSALARLSWGRAMHLTVIKTCFENDTVVISSLITMYSKCGFLNDATLVFERMAKRDTVVWNAMIVAQAYHGFAAEAIDLFLPMIQAGFKPDRVTFLGLLTACAHRGLVDKGWEFFKSMEKDWNLIPKFEHYGCMVDLLGRQGLLTEGYDFIKHIHDALPTQTWETLLSACRVQGNLELGELVAEKVLSIQPSNEGAYVLLSNIYAERGMWEDAANIRVLMKHRGVKKEPACSWIEIKGKTCSFVCDDRSHPQMQEIYKQLESLSVVIDDPSWSLVKK
ncbi:pentatricopeptide repeat-containing protein At4g02750-like [Macadamia integrifolia]|uniref:pentatricopeptide repeat-containing protein At4g02750-like n=1 Tax=Macadamia integrifolia TaxID=60698 RepID=UPI001C4F7D04|nr:pentatricopeptide repeat-containing protein At4g02750-like [Macadamia integrifolia]